MNIELELNKKYHKGLEELKKELEEEYPGWIKERRKEYLLPEMIKCLIFLAPFQEWYKDATERNVDYLTKRIVQIFAKYEYWKKRLHKLFMEYKFTILREPSDSKITSTMIERAKEYSIKDIIEVNKSGFALCPFHEDKKHPNFYVKNNWGYCFACGWSGDCIKFVMDRDKIGFKQAVEFLCK